MRPVLGGRQPLVGIAVTCAHCSKAGTPTRSPLPTLAWCVQRGQSWQKALLPHCPGLGHKTREKQACRFIPELFCFCDTLLSQPDRMRNKCHQNTMREAILESVYSPASLENVWLPPKTANSHCVSKPVSELSGTYPNRIWTF